MIGASLLLLAAATAPAADVAPKPLFRDPVHDGAADPSTVYDPATREWVMFYTNRRADLPMEDEKDVRWVHGTAIGTARSKDGVHWRYGGTASIPTSCTGETLWAPDIERFNGEWHMWLTVVPGVFRDWNAPRFIVHLTSPDLKSWTCGDRLDLGSDRVIDASVVALPEGGYRLFFNDERMGKAIRTADSKDLVHWSVKDRLTATPAKAPRRSGGKAAGGWFPTPGRGCSSCAAMTASNGPPSPATSLPRPDRHRPTAPRASIPM